MYKDYFGLKEEPFSISPDPQFLYMSDRHREALAHLVYGMKTDGGFVLLTGEVGTGKTTICRCLLSQIPENSEIAYVLNPKLTALELLATICDELRILYPQGNTSSKVFIDAINSFLLAAHSKGRNTVLIIDEAQNLDVDVLEQIRLLTNLETDKQKLLQIIMLGQPELKQMLERPELRQLEQRITARYHLNPLSKNDIKAYLCHRLAVAGVERPLFPQATVSKLYQLSGGVPRLINVLCDRALLGAYVKDQNTVSPALLREAAGEVFGKKTPGRSVGSHTLQWALLIILLLLAVGLLAIILPGQFQQQTIVRMPIPPASTPPAQKLELDSLRWTSELPIKQSSFLAYQVLFQLWGVNFEQADGTARAHATRHGLQLLSKRGSLGRLRQLNRPVVLKLANPQGQEYYVTLRALDAQTATLDAGGQSLRVSIASLIEQWFGEFSLLWQEPPNYQAGLGAGDQAPMVFWLEKQMAELNGRQVRSGVNLLDRQLLEEIQQFQTASGLEPDGIVGAYTLICINGRTSDRQPTLADGQGG